MATNLRLSEEAAAALLAEAQRTGRSQQDLLREAVHRYLGLATVESSRARAVAAGLVRPPTPFVDVQPELTLAGGCSTLDLLDRDER